MKAKRVNENKREFKELTFEELPERLQRQFKNDFKNVNTKDLNIKYDLKSEMYYINFNVYVMTKENHQSVEFVTKAQIEYAFYDDTDDLYNVYLVFRPNQRSAKVVKPRTIERYYKYYKNRKMRECI